MNPGSSQSSNDESQDESQHSQTASRTLLNLRGITKAFPGCLANDAIDLDIYRREIHALLGQNGAGKSTLVKIIYGLLQADRGSIAWAGENLTIKSPAHARRMGIGMVFQHFSLFDSLTVQENIALGISAKATAKATAKLKHLKPGLLRSEILSVSERYGLPLEPDRPVYSLSVGEKQRIEIVRALLQSPQLLIMDEPTSVLTPQEVETLFVTLRQLRDEGVSILYISHKLDEIRTLCDRATILRDGRKVAVTDPASESSESLATLMIGQATARPVRASSTTAKKVSSVDSPDASGETADVAPVVHGLQVRDLSLPIGRDVAVGLHNVSFEVARGEILGIAGVAGNGQDELIRALSGELRGQADAILLTNIGSTDRGVARIDTIDIGHLSSAARRKLGLCVIPEERLGHASVPSMTLTDNALLTGFRRLPLAPAGWIRKRKVNSYTSNIVNRYQVMCESINATAASLSGGNLQKFIVGREMEQSPDVLIVAQPTWGVDAGAAAGIRQSLLDLAADGVAILVVTQDLDELMAISTRIMAICAGRVSSAYPVENLSATDIGILMGGGHLSDQRFSDQQLADIAEH